MIDWKNLQHRAALLRLASERRLLQRAGDDLAAFLLDESWVSQSRRSKELTLTEHGECELLQILGALCPGWQALVQELITMDGAISARAILLLEKRVLREQRVKAVLPPLLNRKTFNAAVAGHSKSDLSVAAQLAFPGIELSGDHGILMRANLGFRLRRGATQHDWYDCDVPMDTMGVVYLAERFLRQSWASGGTMPGAVLTVENPASFHDMKLPDGMMAVLVEGWNTPVALRFLRGLAGDIRLIHFGDFDPAGWHIHYHLQSMLARPMTWLAPDFAVEYIATHALPFKQDDRTWSSLPAAALDRLLTRRLGQEGKWLEQEAITLDDRLLDELKLAIA